MTHKLIKTVLAFLLFTSCNIPRNDAINKMDVGDTKVYTYILDGCEYLGDLNGDNRDNYITHKGNCKNPIHGTQTN